MRNGARPSRRALYPRRIISCAILGFIDTVARCSLGNRRSFTRDPAIADIVHVDVSGEQTVEFVIMPCLKRDIADDSWGPHLKTSVPTWQPGHQQLSREAATIMAKAAASSLGLRSGLVLVVNSESSEMWRLIRHWRWPTASGREPRHGATGRERDTADQKDIGKSSVQIQKIRQALGVISQLARRNLLM